MGGGGAWAGSFSLATLGVVSAQRWIIETSGAPTATAAASPARQLSDLLASFY